MGSERNPNFPSGITLCEDGVVLVYYPGYDYRPELGRFAISIKPQCNGHGEEVVYAIKPNAPVAVWKEEWGIQTFEVMLYPGRHSKNEEGFQFFPRLMCGHDVQLGDYTMAWKRQHAE